MVHVSASCLYSRIRTVNDMYRLEGPLLEQLSIRQNPKMKLYVLPTLSNCLPAVYIS